MLDHEIIFWIGDLNYRLDEALGTEDIFQLIDQSNWAYLRERDQLNLERKKGSVFKDFVEGDLNFAPTYKYQPGTDGYDRRPEVSMISMMMMFAYYLLFFYSSCYCCSFSGLP
jgi:phosphatidylinositol-bisphosphatase